jgi:uncharacterized protein (DUF58 family)
VRPGILLAGDREIAASLALATRRRHAGSAAGEQRSPDPGGGIEFADYREYLSGDDPRSVDWAVYRRLGKLLVRICAEERELTLVIILDASLSMEAGRPAKLAHAKRLACVLAGIALASGNRVGLQVMGPGLVEAFSPERGKTSLEAFEAAAARIGPLPAFSPLAAMRDFIARYARRCVAVLLSDLLYPEWPEVLGSLSVSGCESQVIQVLDAEELEPSVRGETTLVDAENGEEAPVHADAPTLARYATELASFLDSTRSTCSRLGLGWALAPTDGDVERLFRGDLRRERFLC